MIQIMFSMKTITKANDNRNNAEKSELISLIYYAVEEVFIRNSRGMIIISACISFFDQYPIISTDACFISSTIDSNFCSSDFASVIPSAASGTDSKKLRR